MKCLGMSMVVVLVMAVAACRPTGSPEAPAGVGMDEAPVMAPAQIASTDADTTAEVPALRLETVDGAAYDLAERRGKWVVVNFWATWCGPCLEEMPELSALDAMREHIEVIGLAYEDITPEDMRAFLEKHPVVYPIAILDVYAPPEDFATPRGLPLTYLIAPDGKVAKRFLGPVTAHEIEAAIAVAGDPAAG